jgi:hypothetical protein
MEIPASRRCRSIAALDLQLSAIDAMAVDAAEQLLAVGQYHYPKTGVALIDMKEQKTRWSYDWQYSTYEELHSLAFGRELWAALGDCRLRSFSLADGRLTKETGAVSGDSIGRVVLSRDARYAVIEGADDLNRTGWSGGVTRLESFREVVPAEGKADEEARASGPGRNLLLRFRDSASLAWSPDGKLELVSRLRGHEAAPLLVLQERSGAILDEIRFVREADFALAATFSDDSTRFYVGTQSGLIFAWVI